MSLTFSLLYHGGFHTSKRHIPISHQTGHIYYMDIPHNITNRKLPEKYDQNITQSHATSQNVYPAHIEK